MGLFLGRRDRSARGGGLSGAGRRPIRVLLVLVFIPVLVVLGVLASAVLGQHAESPPASPAAPQPAGIAAARPPVGAPPPVAPAPAPAAAQAPAAPGEAAPQPVAPEPAAPQPAPQALEPPEEAATPSAGGYVPRGAERIDVGDGAQGAAIFRTPGTAARPGPVVVFLHGWVAIDPARYGAWIGHLVREGATVIYPAYQTRPAYDTIAPLENVLAGVRSALDVVRVDPRRLVVAGHSAGGALAADYAAVAAGNGLPAPAAVLSVYPGRRLRHLAVPIPSADLGAIAPGTRVLALAGERDTSVGRVTARRIVAGARSADATLRIVTDDGVDDHSAPRRFDGAAQRAFWRPLDALVAATAPGGGQGPAGSAAARTH